MVKIQKPIGGRAKVDIGPIGVLNMLIGYIQI
jgi:hypothetical protein